MLWLIFIAAFVILWAVFYAAMPALRTLGRAMARVTARSARVKRFTAGYAPVVAILVAGGLLAMWAADGFSDLAEQVHGKSPALQKIDGAVHDFVVSHRSPGDTMFFVAMTIIGGPVGVGVITGIVAIILAIRRRWRWLFYLLGTTIGGALLNMALKQYFARARPAVAAMLRRAAGYSFPSGHAMGSTVVFGALAYLAYRAAKSWSAAAAALALATTIIISVSLSRVYLGVHWVSDVAAGISAGLVWVLTTTVAYETVRRIRRIRTMRAGGPPYGPPEAYTDREPIVRS